ncbi:MAG: hypothetical protein QW794_00180 [Thermosphaera sp.]
MPEFTVRKGEKSARALHLTFLSLVADPPLVPGRVWFRSDLGQLRWTPDGETILFLDPPSEESKVVTLGEREVYFLPDLSVVSSVHSIFFSMLSEDPPLKPGKVWFRSDLRQLRWTPDGSTVYILSP